MPRNYLNTTSAIAAQVGSVSSGSADSTSFDDAQSNMGAGTAQEAIDAMDLRQDRMETEITTVENTSYSNYADGRI